MSDLIPGQGCRRDGDVWIYLGSRLNDDQLHMVLREDGTVIQLFEGAGIPVPCERPDWFTADRFPGWFEPSLPPAPEGTTWRLVSDELHDLLMRVRHVSDTERIHDLVRVADYYELNAPPEPEPPAITVGTWWQFTGGERYYCPGIYVVSVSPSFVVYWDAGEDEWRPNSIDMPTALEILKPIEPPTIAGDLYELLGVPQPEGNE